MMISALTVFVAGYWGGQQYFPADSKAPLLLGLFGMLGILIIETVLFMIRVDAVHERHEAVPDRMRSQKLLSREQLAAVMRNTMPSADEIAVERAAITAAVESAK
jgi:hypothetical protein